ncbi:endonuclease/exonuclease/phosphatase family protein [Pleurocapsa sp. PCC 7319]|uniref:endonuclease/exonuclease/phosphatase family protein n=1 Tax=Pleurocapsa sp. PCC 7319 TaxID=118161 RepID=UPI00034662D0|nr:endonuclease/exonuclease/phosphatase family protein [Pleurocapsa sp. PCC 7319]
MIQLEERTRIAREVLDTHAKNLETEFTTFEEFQDLFVDVFGNNLGSSDKLVNLQNKFADGTLRPEVKFVSSEVLIDAQGITHGAAFDQKSQTILLSEDLDAAGIESSIEQEIGHWWDVQLNGTEDTTTLDGQPFDEGTAYAERFSQGAKGNNIFSDLVYQNDSHTILVNGQETEVEFRPIATWNINGNTNSGSNTLAEVFNIMENPDQGLQPIEVMALQEVSRFTLQGALGEIAEPGTLEVESFQQPAINNDNFILEGRQFDFQRNGINYRLFYNDTSGSEDLGTAIVLRDPPSSENTTPLLFANTNNAINTNQRGFIGVSTPEGTYISVHASSGSSTNTGNNAVDSLNDILDFSQNLDNVFVLGDFNRDIANGNEATGNIVGAFPSRPGQDLNQWDQDLIPPDDFTFNARENPVATLDYLFTEADLITQGGTVLNQLPNANTQAFPSDHFPVVYDDAVQDGTEFIDSVISSDPGSPSDVLDIAAPDLSGGPMLTDIESMIAPRSEL